MSFAKLMQSAAFTGAGLEVEIPDTWTQGRTAYGGLTSALCLAAARRQIAEDRPLRSALIAFVGPSAGSVKVDGERLREGRTASSARARLSGASGPAVDAIFTFSPARESVLDHAPPAAPAEAMPAPDADARALEFPDTSPAFIHEFDFVWAGGAAPFSGAREPYELSWVRHRDPASRSHPLGLVCLADAMAPAIAPMLNGPAPLSSMTWMIDFLLDDPQTREGWWLLELRADHGAGGHSTQDMTIWNADGVCVAKGRQMVTVFA